MTSLPNAIIANITKLLRVQSHTESNANEI